MVHVARTGALCAQIQHILTRLRDTHSQSCKSALYVKAYSALEPSSKGSDEANQQSPEDAESKNLRNNSQITEKHWLDRRLPGVRQWLEDKNRKLWIRGVQERCRQYPSLLDRQSYLKEQLEKRYSSLIAKHKHSAKDERAETHLQMGCLVIATEQVLKPWIRNSEEIIDILRAQMGASMSPVVRFLLRYVVYLLSDPFSSAARRLRWLRLDYGSSFAADYGETDRTAKLRITDCFYSRLLTAEGAEHLLCCCCCSQDSVWFEHLQRHGIEFRREEWLGAGDGGCCLSLSRSNRQRGSKVP